MVNIELALKHLFVKFVCTDDQEFKNYLSKGLDLKERWFAIKKKLSEKESTYLLLKSVFSIRKTASAERYCDGEQKYKTLFGEYIRVFIQHIKRWKKPKH